MPSAVRVSRTPSIGSAYYEMAWLGFVYPYVEAGVQQLISGSVVNSSVFDYLGGVPDGNASGTMSEVKDTNLSWRAKAASSGDGIKVSIAVGFKSYADPASMPAPGSSAVTASTATITSNTYTPNVVVSTYTVTLYYKKTADSTWTTAATGTANPLTANLTGLTPSTQYQFYAGIVRTTSNATTASSSIGSFTTAAAAPTITTVAASSIGAVSAVVNATVDPNDISTDVSFEYDTGSGAPYSFDTGVLDPPAQTFTGDGDQAVSKLIGELANSTTYYYRAKAVYASGTIYGSELSFTTTGDPSQEAKDEDMLPIQSFDRKYGVQCTVFFVAPVIAATSSNSFYTGAGTIWDAAGESKISKDGGAFSDTTNNPSQVDGALYKIVLTAAEMAADDIFVIFSDGATAVRDVLIHVRTHLALGSVDIDAATGTKANTTAFKVTGYGAGHGLSAVGGATGQDINGILGKHSLQSGLVAAGTAGTTLRLASTAVATDDFYNGSIVLITSGTGIGQSRVIVDYALTNKEATINKTWVATPVTGDGYVIIPGNDLWEVSPAVELAALPTAASGFGKMLQFLFQRFAYKRTQTSNTHTMLKANSTDTFASAGVADSGGTQSFNKLA